MVCNAVRAKQKSWFSSITVVPVVGLFVMLSSLMLPIQAEGAQPTKPLEVVRGKGCYTYGDNQTPAYARELAQQMAQENAVVSHRVYVSTAATTKNFQLEKTVIQTASAAMLHDLKIEKVEKKEQAICVELSAKLNPQEVEDMINKTVQAKEVNSDAAKALGFAPWPGAGVRVSTNRVDGQFVEGERLIISITPERDGYLVLDYFQADGTVVHLVPNIFLRGDVKVEAGKTYTFGDGTSPPHFVIQGPFGNETIKVILTPEPLKLPTAADKKVEDSQKYLGKTRGIVITGPVGVEESVSLVTVSKALNDYRGVTK